MRGTGKRSTVKRGPQGSAKRAKKKDYGDDEEPLFFDDDATKKQADDEEDDEEPAETADQLRLRLAREYLSKIEDEETERDDRRGVTGGSESEGEGEDEEEEEDVRALTAEARRQRLAERLQQDVAQAQGRLQRRLAGRVRVPAPGDEGYCEPSCSRGHRLAATGLALTSDDATAYTVSKDGGICRWDVETGKRTQLYRWGPGAGASGAGDGAIRLWSVNPSKSGGAGGLSCLGALPQRGFVNGLAIARSGRFVAAAVGQEPRMGRWARDPRARNGLALHRLHVE
ncbi:hypothetical protein GPECTOR_132g605 [Gonium pectorale]|uniref:Uncharacterized protein n=1 Tax=Gonium pectorale TaxID=33097 RepID=A0A150FY95_GONPE|nr:hypothetical protein GPECTOR_132g605 [Gonium pectorale]|eukprot:KXZ42593.1 hypothetical protein GPECTOR_132g605 [Gonium pectorale]